MPERSGRELLYEWRQVMDSLFASAASAAERSGLPRDLVGAMQRQFEVVQEVIERERRLQRQLASLLVAPVDAVFDLLEETGATLRRQAEALQAAGRALDETAGLMKRQAELFERSMVLLRQPTELAKAATGLDRQANQSQTPAPSHEPRASRGKPRASRGKPRAPGK